jgi:hypothetical protein
MQDDLIFAAWREGEDPDRAVHSARVTATSVLSSAQPMDVKLGLLEAAAEPLLDAPGGDPMFVYRVASIIARENAFHERTARVPVEQRLRRRTRVAVLEARGLHCAGESYAAFRAFLATLTAVESLAEGRNGLLAKMGNRPPNVCAECAVAALGIGAASLRRAGIAERSRAFWTKQIRDLARHYMQDPDDPSAVHLYPGTPSLVQVLYLLAADGDPEDAELIRALHVLDKTARPSDRRALATVPLREVAVAAYEGDAERLVEQANIARPRLERHPLPRHLAVVDTLGYLDRGEGRSGR